LVPDGADGDALHGAGRATSHRTAGGVGDRCRRGCLHVGPGRLLLLIVGGLRRFLRLALLASAARTTDRRCGLLRDIASIHSPSPPSQLSVAGGRSWMGAPATDSSFSCSTATRPEREDQA